MASSTFGASKIDRVGAHQGHSLTLTEPFTAGRAVSRLLFDFGVMASLMKPTVLDQPVLDFGSGTGWVSEFSAQGGHGRGAGGGDQADIYTAPSAEAAEAELDTFEAARRGRGTKFPTVLAAWRRAWDRVIPFFAFPSPIRKVIYTTAPVRPPAPTKLMLR